MEHDEVYDRSASIVLNIQFLSSSIEEIFESRKCHSIFRMIIFNILCIKCCAFASEYKLPLSLKKILVNRVQNSPSTFNYPGIFQCHITASNSFCGKVSFLISNFTCFWHFAYLLVPKDLSHLLNICSCWSIMRFCFLWAFLNAMKSKKKFKDMKRLDLDVIGKE